MQVTAYFTHDLPANATDSNCLAERNELDQ